MPNTHPFALPALMTAETAESLAGSLGLLPIGHKALVTLDASEVESLSSSGAQILVALKKSIDAQEGTLRITHPKSQFTEALADLGLGWLIQA